MIYCKQEEPFGCAIACIAMILDKTYQEIKSLLPHERGYGNRNGMTSHDYISFMWTQGYIGMTTYACESHTQKIRQYDEWINPLSKVNIVSTITENGPHALVWDGRIIYDPNRDGTYLINHYKSIQAITGFWNLNYLIPEGLAIDKTTLK